MKFKFLTGDMNWQTYGGKFVSKKLNNGDFDYWLVLEVLNWKDAVGEREAPATYNVSLSAVSPSEVSQDNLDSAFRYCGLEDNQELKNKPLVQVETLHGYGISALLWQQDGNNLKTLLKEAHNQAICCEGLFGFYMDAPKNRIGSTGWDCIKGDILVGLNK